MPAALIVTVAPWTTFCIFFTEFTEAIDIDTDGISKHKLSPCNAYTTL